MIVLVTGGRTYNDRAAVDFILSRIHMKKPITLLVEGGADGADTHARNWAIRNGIPHRTYPISKEDWERYGKRAGRRRNHQMLTQAKPQLVVAFPGGPGTQHMTQIAHEAGLPILQSRKFLEV